jgi:small GTP-binding protein
MLNVLLCGDEMCGKSSIVKRLEDSSYTEQYEPTIAVDFKQLYVKNITFQICDTSGKSRFEQIVANRASFAHIIIFVFDISNFSSFESIESRWLKLVLWDERKSKSGCFGYLIATKSDLKSNVNDDVINDFCNTHSLKYFKMSSLHNEGVQTGFTTILERALDHHVKEVREGRVGILKQQQFDESLLNDGLDDYVKTSKHRCRCCFCCCCKKKSFILI